MATILVVDDDANIRELVCLFLRNDGFETVEATDGKEALIRAVVQTGRYARPSLYAGAVNRSNLGH